MAWCLMAPSYNLSQCWSRCMSPYGITRTQWVNSLRPRQNGRHFADNVFKCIFLNENVWILFKISLKFVPKGPINNIPSLVQVMAWRRPGDKPLSEPMMVSLLAHICVARPQWVKTASAPSQVIVLWHFFSKQSHTSKGHDLQNISFSTCTYYLIPKIFLVFHRYIWIINFSRSCIESNLHQYHFKSKTKLKHFFFKFCVPYLIIKIFHIT